MEEPREISQSLDRLRLTTPREVFRDTRDPQVIIGRDAVQHLVLNAKQRLLRTGHSLESPELPPFSVLPLSLGCLAHWPVN